VLSGPDKASYQSQNTHHMNLAEYIKTSASSDGLSLASSMSLST